MEWTSFVAGLFIGGIVVVVLATPTGRAITGGVGRAAGERAEYHIRPRKR